MLCKSSIPSLYPPSTLLAIVVNNWKKVTTITSAVCVDLFGLRSAGSAGFASAAGAAGVPAAGAAAGAGVSTSNNLLKSENFSTLSFIINFFLYCIYQ